MSSFILKRNPNESTRQGETQAAPKCGDVIADEVNAVRV